ncbi:MAG: hypothetical protein AB8B46_01090 [Candidatus Midichloriaceae bacterium]
MWKKRGRPKNSIYLINKGTPELQAKRRMNLTSESLDICLKKNIIDNDQHRSSIKLRWFYTVIFGAPIIQSKLIKLDFFKSKNYDEVFLQKLEKKYYEVLQQLKEIYAHRIVMSICIHNEFPKFLILGKYCDNQKEKFIQGMILLDEELNKIMQ